MQKDLLQHLLCDIKTKDGIRDEKKELEENTLGSFLFFLLRIFHLYTTNKTKLEKRNLYCAQKL